MCKGISKEPEKNIQGKLCMTYWFLRICNKYAREWNVQGIWKECAKNVRYVQGCKRNARIVQIMLPGWGSHVTQHTSKRRDPVWGNVSVAPPYAPAALPLPTPLLEPHLAPLSEPPWGAERERQLADAVSTAAKRGAAPAPHRQRQMDNEWHGRILWGVSRTKNAQRMSKKTQCLNNTLQYPNT